MYYSKHALSMRIAFALLLAVTGCGGGGSDSAVTDGQTTTYTINTDTGTGGSISPISATVHDGGTTSFTLVSNAGYALGTVSGCGGTLNGSIYTTGPVTTDCTISAAFSPLPVIFTTGQAAAISIGTGVVSTTQSDFNTPFGNAAVVDGALYLSDYSNNRVLGFNAIPTTSGANADFVLGQPDFVTKTAGTSLSQMNGPQTVAGYGGKLFVMETNSFRVDVYDPAPTAATSSPNAVSAQSISYTVTASAVGGFFWPETLALGGGKLVVTDSANNRVLIWNTIPTGDTAPDLVLGQTDFTSTAANAGGAPSASTLNYPAGVWTDGVRLVVIDNSNHRVLIWNSFPTSNAQAADRVLGQADFTSNSPNRGSTLAADTLQYPYDGVFVANDQLFIADFSNNRVLIWNTWPTTDGQAADVVLGEPDFVTKSNTFMNGPSGVYVVGSQLIVTDTYTHRYLIYNGSY